MLPAWIPVHTDGLRSAGFGLLLKPKNSPSLLHWFLFCLRLRVRPVPYALHRVPCVQAKAEAARSRTEADCTFKPELVTRKSVQVTREGSVFDTLYKKVRQRICTARWYFMLPQGAT